MKKQKKILAKMLSIVFVASMILNTCVMNIHAAETMNIGLKNWTGTLTNANGTVYLDATEKYSGNYSMKIQMDPTPKLEDQMRLNVTFPGIKPGSIYRLGYKAKAQNAQYIQTTIENISVWVSTSVEFGTSFNWTDFEFEFVVPEDFTTTTGKFIIFSKAQCDGFWIDDLYCYEYKDGAFVGNNLIQNPGFEEGGNAPIIKEENNKDKQTEKFEDITSRDALIAAEARNVVIDGNISEWSQYEKQDITTYDPLVEADRTIEANIRYCYDETAFYYLLEVEDDQHNYVEGSRYWSGDGVQSVIDNNNANGYGEPIGYYFDTGKNKVVFISDNGGTEISDVSPDNPKGAAKREEGKTYYEIKIPWRYLGMECPDKVKFNLIINDNDTGTRLGWLEIAPGIGRTKSNAEYPILVLGNNGGGISSTSFEESTINRGEKLYLNVSYSNVRTKDVDITIKAGDIEEAVGVASLKKYTKTIELQSSDEVGVIPYEVCIDDGEKNEKFVLNVTIIPDNEFVNDFVASIKKWTEELKDFRDKCKARGIATEYENADIRLLESYLETIPWEIANNAEGYERVAHFYTILPQVYEECRSSLKALLSGEKQPFDIPEFVTSNIEIRNGAYWATVEKDGVLYESPVVFNGFTGYTTPEYWIDDIANYGMNHAEIGVYATTMLNWNGSELEVIPEAERYGKRADEYAWERVIASLEECEKKGVSVSLMVSAMAYPKLGTSVVDYTHSTNHTYNPFNVNHPMVELVADAVYKEIGKLCERYACIDNICMLNEPTVKLVGNPYYDDQWADFLSKRYDGDISKLNAVYGDGAKYTDFTQIQMPSTVLYNPLYHDYRMFCEDVYGQFIKTLSTAARKYTDVKLSVKEMQRSRIYNSDYTLNFATTLEKNAHLLDLAGCDAFYIPNRTDLSLDIKMMWYDYITSIMEAPVQNGEDHIGTDGQGSNDAISDDESYNVSSWQGIIHGGGSQDNWHYLANEKMKKTAAGNVEFEPYVHLRKRPNSMRDLYTNNLDAMRLAYEVNSLVTAPRKVGILWANTSWSYSGKFMNGLYRAYKSTIQNGQRAKFITEYTLEQLDKVDLLIVPGSVNVLPETLEAVHAFAERGGRVILLGEDSLSKDDYNQPNDQNILSNIKIKARIIESDVLESGSSISLPDDYEKVMTEEFTNAGIMDVILVDKETGEKVENFEWIHNTFNGDMIINPFNYNKTEAKTVEIWIDGKKANKISDIKNGKEYTNEITIDPEETYLLKIEKDMFRDISDVAWAHEAIYALRDDGIINGIGDNMFAPNEHITREEIAKMIVLCSKAQVENNATPFSDVNPSEWYAPYVSTAYSTGITKGVSSIEFGVGNYISRQDLAVMIYRVAQNMGLVADNAISEVSFSDSAECSDYATEAIAYLATKGVINGVGNNLFMPKQLCTRAEAAKILFSLFYK